jgi:hypothetical protein
MRCDKCCKIDGDAFVAITVTDLLNISKGLNLTTFDFLDKYCQWMSDDLLAIKVSNGYCIFYENGCKIQDFKPVQCSSFPNWGFIIENPDHPELDRYLEICEGFGKGELKPIDQDKIWNANGIIRK